MLLQKSIDTPDVCFGGITETELIDCDVLEASNTRNEMEYETSGRVHRDHVERRDTRSRSPSKYYNEKVRCAIHIHDNVS
jgi:hypothetical protein